jgi:hypothetical protein
LFRIYKVKIKMNRYIKLFEEFSSQPTENEILDMLKSFLKNGAQLSDDEQKFISEVKYTISNIKEFYDMLNFDETDFTEESALMSAVSSYVNDKNPMSFIDENIGNYEINSGNYEIIGDSIELIIDACNHINKILKDNNANYVLKIIDESGHKTENKFSVHVYLVYDNKDFISKNIKKINDYVDNDITLDYDYDSQEFYIKATDKQDITDFVNSVNDKFVQQNMQLNILDLSVSKSLVRLEPIPGKVVREINDIMDDIDPNLRIIKSA